MIKLPQPVSANVYWRKGKFGQMHRTPEADAYKLQVRTICNAMHVHPLTGKLRATIYIGSSTTARDTDNNIKVLLDACQGSLYENDNQIDSLIVERCEAPAPKRENACVMIDVAPLPDGWSDHIRRRMYGK